MSVDRYTKVVLTVIAACLVWLSLGGTSLLPTAHAQNNSRVIVAGWLDEKGEVRPLPSPDSYRNARPAGLPVRTQ